MVPMPRPTAALLRRLEVLNDEPGAACCRDLRALAEQAAGAPEFKPLQQRYAALADARRLTAVSLLKRAGEMCGCELQAALGLTHATVSHHMAALLEAGIVAAEKRGKWTHYRLAPGAEAWVP